MLWFCITRSRLVLNGKGRTDKLEGRGGFFQYSDSLSFQLKKLTVFKPIPLKLKNQSEPGLAWGEAQRCGFAPRLGVSKRRSHTLG